MFFFKFVYIFRVVLILLGLEPLMHRDGVYLPWGLEQVPQLLSLQLREAGHQVLHAGTLKQNHRLRSCGFPTALVVSG